MSDISEHTERRLALFGCLIIVLVLVASLLWSAPPPPRIIWASADALAFTDANGPHYGKIMVTAPGAAGTPWPGALPSDPVPSLCPSTHLDRLDDTGRWRCRGIGFKRAWNWIMPPPVTPCGHSTEPKQQNGYTCVQTAGLGTFWRVDDRGYHWRGPGTRP
jgi:hypothetical protein